MKKSIFVLGIIATLFIASGIGMISINRSPGQESLKQSSSEQKALEQALSKQKPVNNSVIDPTKLRGFNLQSEILTGERVNGDAEEWAFKFMADEGFNFARIPMEVQELYVDSEYTVWNDDALLEIDRIIALGQKYNIHILLDLHTLPGIRPGGIEPTDSDIDSDERLIIWKNIFYVISRRYQDVPSRDLSYNLINEPNLIETEEYIDNIRQVWSVIREVDPTRLLFIDPNYSNSQSLYDLSSFDDPYLVASPHFYQPFFVTHYLAEWVEGAEFYPEPQYPSVDFNGFIYGSYHPDLHQPLLLQGDLKKGTKITLRIQEVSDFAELSISTENEQLRRRSFQTNADASVWKVIQYNEAWQIYQNLYDKDIFATLREDSQEIRVELLRGDWLRLSSITLDSPEWEKSLKIEVRSLDWGIAPGSLSITEKGKIDYDNTPRIVNKDYLFEEAYKEWTLFEKKTQIPVVACEFGVYNKTSHDIAQRVIEDHLSLMKENDFGYAFWNLSGKFGVFDSDRKDVEYENYEGHQLDRDLLELLKKY